MCKNKNEKVLSQVWGSVGFIMHLCHLIEYNLALIYIDNLILKDLLLVENLDFSLFDEIVAKHNEEKKECILHKTLEKLLTKNEKVHSFTSDFHNELIGVKELRNYYGHDYFKTQLYTREIDSNPQLLIPGLQNDIQLFKQYHEKLYEIEIGLRNKIEEIRNNISN